MRKSSLKRRVFALVLAVSEQRHLTTRGSFWIKQTKKNTKICLGTHLTTRGQHSWRQVKPKDHILHSLRRFLRATTLHSLAQWNRLFPLSSRKNTKMNQVWWILNYHNCLNLTVRSKHFLPARGLPVWRSLDSQIESKHNECPPSCRMKLQTKDQGTLKQNANDVMTCVNQSHHRRLNFSCTLIGWEYMVTFNPRCVHVRDSNVGLQTEQRRIW